MAGVRRDRGDHHVAARAGDFRRFDQEDGGAVVDRFLSLGARAWPGAGGEDDRVGAGDRVGELLGLGALEVDDDGLAASRGDVLGMGWVADEREDAVAALGEEPREEQSDLPVPTCDCHDHAPETISAHR